jgi:hypothetical protein
MNRKLSFTGTGILCLVLMYALHYGGTAGAATAVKEAPAATPAPAAASENKITIGHTEIFGKLQRSPVIFNHDKHDAAYKQEGCGTCHPEIDGQLSFVFPKKRNTDKTAVMNAYHDQCFACHKKASAENKKTGPINCGGCHKAEGK